MTRIVGVRRTAATSAASHVAADPHDAALRMRRLARQLQRAVEVAVEGDAVAEEVGDAVGRLQRHAARHALVDQAVTGGDGVGNVLVDGVAGADRRGNAALRPGRGGAFADRRAGNHGDRAGRELQRAEQAGQPAADDDDVVDAFPGGGGKRGDHGGDT
jgi:hypothetical protein